MVEYEGHEPAVPARVWSMLKNAFVRNNRDDAVRSPGQIALLQGVRLRNNKDIGDIIKNSSVRWTPFVGPL